jgi:hypothetical protein
MIAQRLTSVAEIGARIRAGGPARSAMGVRYERPLTKEVVGGAAR